MRIRAVFQDYFFIQKIDRAKKINGLYYSLQKIPLLGHKLPNKFYNALGLKEIWNAILLGVNILWKPIGSALTLAVCYLAAALIGNGLINDVDNIFKFDSATLNLTIAFWIILSPMIGHGFTSLIRSLDETSLATMISFQLDRLNFVCSQLYVDVIKTLLAYLPAFILLNLLTHVSPLLLWNGYVSLIALSLLGESIQRWEYQRHPEKDGRIRDVLLFIALVMALIALAIFQFSQQQSSIFATPFYSVFLMLSGLFFISTLRRTSTSNYIYRLVETGLADKNSQSEITSNQYVSQGLALQKKLTLDDKTVLEPLKSKQAVNELLFRRYRPVLRKGFLFRLGAIALIGIAGIVVELLGLFAFTDQTFISVVPFLFFGMYVTSYGKNIVQMCFVNCDIAMLYYPFYREGRVILAGLFYRFKQTLIYNGTIAGLTFILLALIMWASTAAFSWSILLLLAIVLLSLTLLFSFHELFIYYLLQPFTSEMQVVNPAYKIVSGILYWIAYMNWQIATGTLLYAIILAAVSLVYVGVGAVIIYRQAPKTFRIKN